MTSYKRSVRMQAPYNGWPGSGPRRAGSGPKNMPGWFHPGQGMCVWCGRGDLNPHDLFRVCGFSYHFGFRRLATRVRGLDYPFTIPRERFRCCPSSLYTFPKISGLGSGLPVKVSPTLSSSTPPVSLAGTQFLKSAVSADFTTPAGNWPQPIIKQAMTVYASSAKRTAFTRPGPFFEVALFFGRGLMMLIAEASSRVFRWAA